MIVEVMCQIGMRVGMYGHGRSARVSMSYNVKRKSCNTSPSFYGQPQCTWFWPSTFSRELQREPLRYVVVRRKKKLSNSTCQQIQHARDKPCGLGLKGEILL